MEWVDSKSGKPQVIQGMHTYPSYNTTTQTTKLDLHSEGGEFTVPSLMLMRMFRSALKEERKEEGRGNHTKGAPIEMSPALLLLQRVDPYWRAQILVHYSKYLHTGMILDGMK